jgi:anti-sigma regulatory factor (Ser/Thr protein kinase)
MFRYTISIRNTYAELERALREVTELLQTKGIPSDSVHTVNLGLEEVITNILKYGYDDDQEHQVDIVLLSTPNELRIEVSDDGHEFNPLEHPEPDTHQSLERRRPGGLGISFLRKLFYRMTYQREGGRNCLALYQRVGSS